MTEAARESSTELPPASDPADPVTAASEPTTGGRLRASREKLKLSIFDVARELKLQPRQIEALERDDYAIFSSPVFVRGFLRNYARLLGLDGDALVFASERAGRLPESAVSPGHAGGEATVAPPKPGLREPFDRDRDSQKMGHRGNKHGVPAVVALLLVAGVIVYFHQSTEVRPPVGGETPPSAVVETAPAPAPAPSDTEGPAPAEAAGTVAGEVQEPPGATDGAAGPQPVTTDAPSSGVAANAAPPVPSTTAMAEASRTTADRPAVPVMAADAQVSTPTLESVEPQPKPSKRTSTPVTGSVAHTGDPEVRLAFSDESWVEVRDASGKVVFSDLGRPGQERVVKGQAPFQVVVGKSSVVSLTYNSRAVDLAPYTQAEVARLTLQ